jgi:hypothetical protein
MKLSNVFRLLFVFAMLVVLLLPVSSVSAHTSFPSGPYIVEIGWLNEPPVAGQPNAIVVNLSVANQSSSSAPVKLDYSGLTLQVDYGGQSKLLTLQPQSEDTPYNLMGVMTPAVMGKYTVTVNGKLGGDLGSTPVSITMQPEEVVGLDSVQFPNLAQWQTSQSSASGWMPVAGLAAGILGILLGVIALMRKSR